MRHMRPIFPVLSIYLVMFGLCISAAACTKNQRIKTIHASLVSVNAARDGFVAWDRQHQTAIVDKATSREQAERELAAYRTRRELVERGVEVTYRAFAVAATQTDDLSLRAALETGAALVEAIKQLRGGS